MNTLRKIVLIIIALAILPTVTLAATVSCSPEYSEDYIGKTVSWTGVVEDATGLGESLTYAWTGDDGISGTSENTSLSYATAGEKSATFTVDDGVTSVEASCSVTIYDADTLPELSGSCMSDVSSAVFEQPVTWESNISGGLAPYNVSWGGDASGTGDNVIETYTATGTKVAIMTNIESRYPELPKLNSGISCDPGVPIYSSIPEYFADNGTSCSVSDNSVGVLDEVVWTVDIQTFNGFEPYTVSWTGDDGLSGDGLTITKSYSTPGLKTAKIYSIVSGDGQSIESEIACSNSVTVSTNNGGSSSGGSNNSNSTTTATTTTPTSNSNSTTTEPTNDIVTILDLLAKYGVSEEGFANAGAGALLAEASTTAEISTTTEASSTNVLEGQTAGLFSIFFNNGQIDWAMVLSLLVIAIILIGGVWYLFIWKKKDQDSSTPKV